MGAEVRFEKIQTITKINMSGGSWDYFYNGIESVSSRLQQEKDPLRRAFGNHLVKVAAALHDIEWVDSCDYGPGDEVAAIKAVLGINADAETIKEARKQAEVAFNQLQSLLATQKGNQ